MREKKGKSRRFITLLTVFAIGIFIGFSAKQNTVSAASDYQIKVNKQENCVTVYQKNAKGKYKPIKAFVCSTGYATKTGTYSLGTKYRWHTLDGPCYGQYCSRIYDGVLFHSVWYRGYNDPSTLATSEYNKLGTTCSHGCVRLTVADAKWIYDNVPSGTSVIIYTSSDPGPLGKPAAIQVPSTCTWDPTDTGNPDNPWNNKKPSVTVKKKQKVEYNSTFDVMDGVTATNTTGYDATDLVKTKITYQGKKVKKVNTKKPGTYTVTYTLKDEIGRKASAKAKITVKQAKEAPVITGAKPVYVTDKSKLTKKRLLKGVTVTQEGKTLDNSYVTIKTKKIEKNVYRITYIAQRASLPTKVKVKAYVDSQAPVITGITDGMTYTVKDGILIDEDYVRGLLTGVSDNVSKVKKSDVTVTLTQKKDGTVKAVCKLKDDAGNKTKIVIYLVSANDEQTDESENRDEKEGDSDDSTQADVDVSVETETDDAVSE